jgi:hypothetical protein
MLSPDTVNELKSRHKHSEDVIDTARNAAQQSQLTTNQLFNQATEAMVNRQYVLSRLVPSDEKVYDQFSLEYFRVDFAAEVEIGQPITALHEPHDNGTIVLTNKRMIFLAAEHEDRTRFDNKPPHIKLNKPFPGLNRDQGYKVNQKLYDRMAYFSLPLGSIQHGISINAEHDVETESGVYFTRKSCFACCGKNCK